MPYDSKDQRRTLQTYSTRQEFTNLPPLRAIQRITGTSECDHGTSENDQRITGTCSEFKPECFRLTPLSIDIKKSNSQMVEPAKYVTRNSTTHNINQEIPMVEPAKQVVPNSMNPEILLESDQFKKTAPDQFNGQNFKIFRIRNSIPFLMHKYS